MRDLKIDDTGSRPDDCCAHAQPHPSAYTAYGFFSFFFTMESDIFHVLRSESESCDSSEPVTSAPFFSAKVVRILLS